MQPDVIQLSDELQDEAHILLRDPILWQPFAANGKIHVAGSTDLNLLVFPDLPVYFEAADPAHILDVFAKAAKTLILRAKYRLMIPFGRTPVGSSYLVYKAVLEEGLDDVDQIISYIRDQGRNVDKLK